MNRTIRKTQIHVLQLLVGKRSTGWDIATRSAGKVKLNSVYASLYGLMRRGMVEAEWEGRSRYYTLTTGGRQQLAMLDKRWYRQVNTLFDRLVRADGACCAYGFLTATANESAQDIADRLGVARWTITRWRKDLREGWVRCEEATGCRTPPPSPDTAAGTASPADDPAP